MGGFQFQESHPEMVRPGVPMSEDDILPNWTDTNTMEKLNKGIPFKGGQEMHVSTLKARIDLCNPLGSLVVTMNSSMLCHLDFSLQVQNNSLCFLIIKILLSLIVW
jgi:hypothetical protein